MALRVVLHLLSNLSILFLAVSFAALACLLGRPLLARWTRSPGRGLEDAVMAGGLGAGLIGFALFAMGVAGLWFPAAIGGFALGALAVGLRLNRDLWKGIRPLKSPPAPWPVPDRLLAGLLAGVFAFWVPSVLTPEVFFDSLSNHLLLPAEWLRAGRWPALPHNCTSAFPSLTELFYLLALAVSDERLAKAVHFLFAVGSGLALLAAGSRYASRRAGLLAALVFFTLPVMGLEFGTTGVEFASTFFSLLSVLAIARASEGLSDARPEVWMSLAGAFAGCAMATKYTLWVFPLAAAAGVLAAPGLRRLGGWGKMRLWGVWFLVPAGAVVLPWIVKNVLFFRNPVYPFLTDVFSGGSGAFHNRGFFFSYAVSAGSLASGGRFLWKWLLEPFVSQGDLGWLWAAWAPFLLLTPVLARKRPWPVLLAIFFTQWLVYGAAVDLMRYRVHVLALLALALGALAELPEVRRVRSWLIVGLVAIATANFAVVLRTPWMGSVWRTAAGLIPMGEYLSRTQALYPAPPYPAFDFVNRSTAADARVLVLGETRTFHLRREALASTIFDVHPVQAVLREASDGGDALERLRAEGVTHAIVNLAEASRLRRLWIPWGEREKQVLLDFLTRHCRKVFEDQNFLKDDFRHTIVYALDEVPSRDPANEEVARLLLGFLGGSASAMPGTASRLEPQ